MSKIFLDACCLYRPTDDQSQQRIRQEAEAIELILSRVRRGTVRVISSSALEQEIARTPSPERRIGAETLLSLATTTIEIDDLVALRAAELIEVGYGTFDALYLAAAEVASADVLLSTDDKFVRRAVAGTGTPRIQVSNPVSWIKEQLS